MSDNNISQKILATIKEHKLHPRPKWEFQLQKTILWLMFGLGIIIGSLATAVIIFLANHSDWSLVGTELQWFEWLLIAIPYFWVLIVGVFLFLAYILFHHTEQGYRYHWYLIVIVSVGISLVFGSFVYAVGGGQQLEQTFYQNLPVYRTFIHQPARILVAPERGLIAGVVVEVADDVVTIRDFNEKIWIIATSTQRFEVGQRILLHGKKTSETEFHSDEMKSWLRPQPVRIKIFERHIPPGAQPSSFERERN